MADNDDPQDDALAKTFLDHLAMEKLRSYLAAGRRFAGLSVANLNAQWALATKAVCANGEMTQLADLDDLSAELDLRDLKKPYELVRDTLTAAERWMKDTIESHPEYLRGLGSDIARFVAESRKPKN